MRFLTLFTTLAVVLPTIVSVSVPQAKEIKKFSGQKNGRHIVKLKPGVSKEKLAERIKLPSTIDDLELINGFSGDLDDNVLKSLAIADEVDYIAEDGSVHGAATIIQNNAPWGLQRVSQAQGLGPNADPNGLGYTFQYDSSAGTGVDIYVIDSGINIAHVDFGGRATFGTTFVSGITIDDHGHGTHCAGTAGSFTYGVAKNSSLIAVKVLDSTNRGWVSDMILGLDWVGQQVALTSRPSVVSMSILADSVSDAFDDAVTNLTAQGIHVVLAAGNANDDAQNWSPARTPSAITVGATDITDAKAWFSNYGAIVDVFAPGVNVISAGIAFNTATAIMSGTSMATPHVAGLVAYLIAKDGNLTPAAMETKVRNLAAVGYITGLPAGTANRMAQVPL